MKLRSTLLFAAASFTASALAPVTMTTSALFAVSTVALHSATGVATETTTYDGTEYSGSLVKWESGTGDLATSLSFSVYDEDSSDFTGSYVSDNSTTYVVLSGGEAEQIFWRNFTSNDYNAGAYGNSLYFTGLSSDTDITAKFGPFTIGGLLVDASGYALSLGRSSGSSELQLAGNQGSGVVLNINSDTNLRGSAYAVSGKNVWSVAEGKTLAFSRSGAINFDPSGLVGSADITIAGKGTVSFGGNTATGEGTLTLSSGTLENLTLESGATLAAGAGGDSKNLSGVTFGDGSVLDLSGLALSESVAVFTVTGAVTFSEGAVVNIGADLAENTNFLIFSTNGGSVAGWDFSTVSFSMGETSLSSRNIELTDTGFSYKKGAGNLDLIWANATGAVWTDGNTDNAWAVAGQDVSASFVSGDSVTFDTEGASVTISGTVAPSKMTVSANTTFTGTGTISITDTNIAVSDGASVSLGKDIVLSLGTEANASLDAANIKGTGTIAWGNNGPSHDGISYNLNDEFTGTLQITGNINPVGLANIGGTQDLTLDGVWFWGASVATIAQDVLVADSVYKEGAHLYISGSGVTFEKTFSAEGKKVYLESGSTTFKGEASIGELKTVGGVNTLNIGEESIVSANSLNNAWGIGTLNVSGILNIAGGLQFATGGQLNTITGGGTISTKTFIIGNVGQYLLTGGVRLEVGSGGITETNDWGYRLRLGDSTLVASDDWSVSADVNPIQLASTENGGVKFDTNGHSVTVNVSLQNLSDTEVGALTKEGAGTLTLSTENSFSGGLTVKNGILVGSSVASFGNGKITLEGGTLKGASVLTLGADRAVSIGGDATIENITLAGATLTFLSKNTLAFGTNAGLTSGTIDLSHLSFTDDAMSVVLFANGSQSLLDIINSSSVTTVGDGLYSLDANNNIIFTAGAGDVLLSWDLSATDKTWTSTSFSGKSFSENQKVVFGTLEGEETVTINEAPASAKIKVDAGAYGTYDFIGSENLTAAEINVHSGTLVLNDLNDSKTIGAISVSDGAALVLNSDNTGFDSISLASGASLVIKSDTAFGNAANNGSTNGAILGTGTIVFDLASTDVFGVVSNTFFNAISNTGLFTGTIQVKQGTFEIDGAYTGKMGKVTAWEVLNGGRLVITGVANAPANIGSNATITLSGSGINGADDSTPNGALVFMQDVAFSSIFSLGGDATVYIAEGKTLTLNSISNVDFGSNTLTLSGLGTFLWSHNGGVNYTSGLEISEGTTFADNGNYKWSLTFTETSALSGAGTLYSRVPTAGTSQGDGYRQVFINGSTKDFTGTWLLENASGNGVGNRKIFGALNSSDGIFGGVIEFYDSTSDAPDPLLISSYLSIGKDMTIGGLKGTTGTVGGSASVGGNTLTQGEAHALTINLAAGADYVFGGKIDSTISSLTISGEGTQTLSGDSSGFNGNVTVSGGTLKATQLAALGSADGALAIDAAGTLELAFGGELSRVLSGTGTLAKSGGESLSITGTAFGGSFDVKEGQLSVNIQNSTFGSLSVGAGATFKTQNTADFSAVTVESGATVQGSDKNTKISLVSGTFAGTLSSATLVKTGSGVLNLSGATFGVGGSVLVEGGGLSALNVATGLEVAIAEDASEVVFSDVVLSGGVFVLNGLSSTNAAASIIGFGAGSTGVSLEIYGLDLETSYKLFTFDSQASVEIWKSLNITSNLDGLGDYSWEGLTLMFTQTRSAGALTWLSGATLWDTEAESWKTESGTVSKFVSTSEVEFTTESLSNGRADVSINSSEKLFVSGITVDVGGNGSVIFSTVGDGSEDLLSSNGINIVSGALLWKVKEGLYDSTFNIGDKGTLNVQRPDGVTDFTLSNTLLGTGVVLHELDSTLTLSGDRSQFTGTLDVNAGTVVLANGKGTEKFSSIDIAGGATVAANGGPAVDGFSTLALGQVSGTGTLSVSAPQGATFFALDLSGSDFTGAVELNAVDMVFAKNPSEAMVTSVSNLANASLVRLTNGASLNFFNEASTFDKNIEVADTNGSIRVYGNNTGTTLSGNISGAGTLTVKDGGKLILSGAVGTADSALGGLTLSAGSLEISGENSSINVSGDVSLTGSSATINTNGTIGGNLVSGAWGVLSPLTLGGNLSIGGNATFVGTGQQGRVTTILENAKISVAGTTSFQDNEAIAVGANATLDSTAITSSQWGFNATLGAGATLSAGTLTFGKDTDSVSGAAEGDASRLEIGTEDGTGTLSGTVVVKDVTIGVREGATAWSSDANVKLNGGATTFDVGDGQEITLNGTITEAVETASGTEGEEGYVAATSSALIKNGAGTLTLGKANANKGGTTLNAGTLKFTNKDGVTLSGSYTFAGGMLAAGEGTTLTLGAGTAFSGAVVYTNDKNGKLLVSEDLSITGEGNSLTLHEKANVEIASGKTLSLGALSFTGNGSKIEGEGTLSLAGTVAVDNNRTNTITSGLALSENTVLAISKGTLEIESEDISTGGKTLTKTGAGTLTLDTDAVYDFDGSFSLQGGTVNVGSRELTISGTHSFELANGATLEGDLVLEKGSSATLGAGKITGDVALSGATLEFSGATSVGGKLSWTDSNTITLDAEFRKTITSTPYTLISFDSKDGDNANLTFTDVEIYGRRSFTLDIGEKKIDLLATGTLVWNANVATWTTNSEEEADWTLEQTSGNTTSAFLANDYVEFRDSGSIVIADDTIQTSGVVFNIANNGSFRLNAPTPATDENGQPTEKQKIVKLTDAVYDNGNTTGKSAGLTVVAGNVTIGNYIVNDLSSVTISSGSLTVFNVDALGIVDKTDSENEKIATLTIGGGVNDDGTPKSATLNISLPGDDGKTEDVNESVGIVDQKVAIVNAGIISVVNANTTVEVSGAISGADAKLTKTGWGALKIKRDSTLGMLAVDSGRLELVGNADAALSIKSVQIGNQGEMFLVGDTDGANTSLDALTVNGKLTVTDGNTETPGLGAYRTGTLQGSGNISGNLYVGADSSFDITTSNTDGSSATTNYKGTAVSGNLTLTGSIASYGTEDAALYKKGTGTLTLVSAEKENDVPKAFTLDASVIHEAGTLAFTHGGVISKNYTIAENATAKLSFNGVNASELSAGITLGTGSSTTIENSGNGTLKINGVSSSGTTKTTLAGTNITLSGDTVDFGKLTKIDDTGVLSALYVNANNVKVDATTFTAGYVAFGNGASLTISKDTTATANALYVGEGVSATLDLTDGAKFSVGTDEEISVFGGTGTLNVKGGTLELKGATYGDEDAPSIVLDKATLAFNVTGAEDAVGAYLDGVSTAEGSTGTIEKTGAGTLMVMEGLVELVFGGEVQDLSFDGEISVTEGNMMLFATASQAEVEIASDTALEFAGSAELADSVDSVNTLAESLSGAGTLNVSGELYVNDASSAFDGTIKASGGTLYVSGATSDWMANGTDRVLFIESGTPLVGTGTAAGKIATYDGSATLTAVSLSGHGIFLGAAEDKALTVEKVSATAGSDLTLQGYGTLGAMKFAEANTDNTIVIGSGANWTIDGESENLEKLSVSGLVTVAHTGALGSAKVLSSGKIIFDAEGTYANLFHLDKGAVIEAKKNTSLTGSFWHTDGSHPAVTFVAGENAKLTLSDSFIEWTTPTFETKDATATIAVDVTSSVKILNSGSKLSGAGTFEKLGDKKLLITADAGTIGAVAVTAGTLEFGANAKLSVAEGGAGTLSVADGATLRIAGTKLGDWTLTGEGSAEVSGTASLGAISSAKDVALSGQLSVSGNISDSSLKFADENTKLTTTGTAAQSVSGTLSGATVTLVNENKAGVTYDAALANDVKTLVLTAASGVNGAVMNAAYAGSLTKTLDGEWTVSDYTFGKTADQKLTVSGGTLIWKGVKLEANAGAISLEKSATLKINGLASGDTLSAEIDGNGTLEIAGTGTAATPLKLDTTAAADSKWMLHVSGGSQVQTSKNLPGALWIEGEGSVLDLNYASDQTVENSRYLVSSGAKLKLSGTGTLTLKDSGDSTNPHIVSGTVEISDGKLVQSGNVAWDPYGTVEIGTNGELAVNVGGSVNNNNATLKGDGKLTIEKTAASGYRFGGEISGFAGTVDIQDGATVKLAKQLFDGAKVKVDGTLNLELSGTPVNDQGEIVPRNLKNISGAGTLVIAAPDDFYTRYGIYDYDTTTNTFAGTLKVESGVLSVEADKAASLAATEVKVGGTSPAEYYEGMWQGASWVGITTGGFLQLKNGNNYDVASLYGNAGKFTFGDNAGTIYSGGTFRAAKDFGVGKNNLFVLDNATLTLTNGASVDGGVFVKSDGSLVVDYTATPGSAALRALSASSENSGLTGNLTLNGILKILVTDDAVNNGALLDVGGKVYLSTDGGNASKIELEVTGTENLDNKRVVVLGGEYGGNVDPNTVVEVTDSAGNRYKVTRDVNGQIVILNAATEYSDVPSGLSGLASVLRDANSPLWDYVQGDLAKSDERLVGLSPVSFGSLVEMQSGFAALENDLLRERLEQRRYERAFISDKKNTFKPFVNIVGSEREGDGNGTESANYDISHTGILGGFDVAVSNNTVFGVSLGFDFAKADLHGGDGKHEGNSTRFGVYGMSVFENTYFGYGLSAGATSFETKRNSGYNGETLSGSTDGNDINASLLFGAGWTLDKERGIDLAPYVGLDFGYAYADGFKEEGGRQTALDVDKTERLSLRGKLGATLSWRATGSLRFSLDAAFAHEFLDSDIDVDAAFASGDLRGKSFSSTAYLMDENTIQIGPRFDYRVDETWSVSGGYSYETDLDDTATHSANLGVRARF